MRDDVCVCRGVDGSGPADEIPHVRVELAFAEDVKRDVVFVDFHGHGRGEDCFPALCLFHGELEDARVYDVIEVVAHRITEAQVEVAHFDETVGGFPLLA